MNWRLATDFLLFLAGCALKATVLLGFAWLAAVAARRSAAAFRHRIWALAIVAVLALPLLMIVLPTWHSTAMSGAAAKLWNAPQAGAMLKDSGDLPAMILNAVVAAPARQVWPSLLFALWLVGFLLFALRIIAGLTRLATLSARGNSLRSTEIERAAREAAASLDFRRHFELCEHPDPAAMPLTWGALRPVILLPTSAQDWTQDRRRIVLTHELAHVARRDWVFQIAAELVRALYWFHPLAWIAARQLREESECACDDVVLQSGVAAPDYAQQLLQLAGALSNRGRAWSSALALARGSHLERRFTAMLNPSLRRGALTFRLRAFTLIACALVVLPLAALRLPAQNVSGKFSGTVVDPSGAVVPNATVIMTDTRTSKTAMTTSDAEGKFSFSSLPSGDYDLRAIKRGFEDFKAKEQLASGQDKTQDIALNVAAVAYEEDVIAKGTVKGVAPGEQGGKTKRVRVGGDIQAGKIVSKVQPVYPEAAKAAGSQGTVVLHAVIGTDGSVLSLRVVNDKVDPALARASIESVSKWRYSPTLLNGQPIEVETTIEVNFTLQA
jgi:TonB family protein